MNSFQNFGQRSANNYRKTQNNHIIKTKIAKHNKMVGEAYKTTTDWSINKRDILVKKKCQLPELTETLPKR